MVAGSRFRRDREPPAVAGQFSLFFSMLAAILVLLSLVLLLAD